MLVVMACLDKMQITTWFTQLLAGCGCMWCNDTCNLPYLQLGMDAEYFLKPYFLWECEQLHPVQKD